MKIAFIGQNSLKGTETELATQFVQHGHKTSLYLNRKKGTGLYNGMRIHYGRYFFAVLHAIFVFRADVILLLDEAKMYKAFISFIAPIVVVKTAPLPEGIYLKRLVASSPVLEGYGLRSGAYAIVSEDAQMNKQTLQELEASIPSDFSLVIVGTQHHREVIQALYAGSAFVIANTRTLEAMSYGKVVLSEESSVCNHVKDVVLSYSTQEELVGTMQQLIEDPMLRAGLGHTAREFAESRRWENVAHWYLEHLKKEAETRIGRFGMLRSYVKR